MILETAGGLKAADMTIVLSGGLLFNIDERGNTLPRKRLKGMFGRSAPFWKGTTCHEMNSEWPGRKRPYSSYPTGGEEGMFRSQTLTLKLKKSEANETP